MKRTIIYIIIFVFLLISLVFCSRCNSNDEGNGKKTMQSETKEEMSKETKASSTTKEMKEQTTSKQEDKDNSGKESSEADDLMKYAVHGYALGEIPAVPIVSIPVLPDYNEKQIKIVEALEKRFASIPGISIKPAIDDGKDGIDYTSDFFITDGKVSITNVDEGSSVIGENGEGVINTDEFSLVISEDGEGVLTSDKINAVVMADGSGTINDLEKQIAVTRNPDGTGVYTSDTFSVTILGEYNAVYASDKFNLTITDENNAVYSDENIEMVVSDGKATVNSKEYGTKVFDAKPIPKVPMIPEFPNLKKLRMTNIRGVRIVIADSILFDFDSSQIRPEGKVEIEKMVKAFNGSDIEAIEVHGHTDSISSDEYNMKLSEDRAKSVEKYLTEKGIKASTKTVGFGEKKPIAPNEFEDGSDNPAGRQANRRVEIFIPRK